jgi:hypothetical protein
MKTLAQFNATPRRHDWGKYTLETRYAVGSQSRRWTSSPKVHLLRTEVVVEDRDPQPGTYKLGGTFSAHAPCNSNGQHTGTVFAKLDTDAITCARCLKAVQE